LSQAASLSLAISIDGQTRWILDPVQIQPGADPVDLGDQVLHGFSGTGFDAAYLCGDTRLHSRRIGDALLLDTGTRSANGVYQLAVTVPAGGAAASGSTEFVSDSTGLRAALSDLDMVVSQDGVDWPLCSPVPPIERGSWRADGRDAAW